jgi:hypothetical protein
LPNRVRSKHPIVLLSPAELAKRMVRPGIS